MSQLIGYARVSTPDQCLDRQLEELCSHGCERVFAETASGKRGAQRCHVEPCARSQGDQPAAARGNAMRLTQEVSARRPATLLRPASS
ncbi:MAG: recombinase family protein [Jatrophihabitans sp.]|uniref:recombinase family protein n=1 Tax=Jatrophihabitans sp. TaxID=1932789 RepID=UPI003916228A